MDSTKAQLRRFRDAVKTALSEMELLTETEIKEDHHRIIQMHYNQLLNCLTAVGDIVAEIFQTGSLTPLELEYLHSFELTPIRATAELLRIVMTKSSSFYKTFLLAVRNAKQQDAYRLLTTTSLECTAQHVVNSAHSLLIREHYDWLTTNIACDTGLITRLRQAGVLTDREIEYIVSKTDKFRKNETFLFTISRKSSEDFAKFQQSLVDTGQNAVVERLKLSPASDSKKLYDSDEHRFLIQRKFCWLSETIVPDCGLIDILYQNEVITTREQEIINTERGAIKMTESLLKIISQKSTTDFEQFMNALGETKQDQVVRRLMEEKSKMIVEFLEVTNTRRVINKQIGYRKKSKPIVPPKPGKQCDGAKPRFKSIDPTADYPPNQEKRKILNIPQFKTNFERLEKSLQVEISWKVTILHQKNRGASQNVGLLQSCLQTILEDTPDSIMELKRKQEAEMKDFIQERKLEKEKFIFETQAVKKILEEEEKLRRNCEEKSKKTNEMYDRMKKQFEKEIGSIRTENDRLSALFENEKVLKENVEQDLEEERKTVWTLRNAIENGKSNIVVADDKSLPIEETLHLVTEQLRSLSSSMSSCFNLETKRLDIAMKKILHLEMKITFFAGKVTSDGLLESSIAKKFEEDLREARSELNAMKEDKHRLENAIEMHKNYLKEADESSEKAQRLFTEMLHSLEKSMTDCFSLETDRLNMAVNKIVDSGKKLNLIEEKIVSVRKKIANAELWTSIGTIKAENENPISAVAISDQELFIANEDSPVIYVYDLSAFTFLRQFKIHGLQNPADMAFCKTKNCLYIMDTSTGVIIRSTTKGKIFNWWSAYCACISVAFDCNIILTTIYTNLIVEYTPEGEEVRRIKLSEKAGLVNPTHSIKLRSGCFLVSYGDFGDSLHRVCVIDLKGQIKMAFGGEEGSDSKPLSWPIHMAINSDGSIIVTDWDRLMLLDANLKFKRVLNLPRMKAARRLEVDELKGRLFVVQYDDVGFRMSGHVSVYKFVHVLNCYTGQQCFWCQRY